MKREFNVEANVGAPGFTVKQSVKTPLNQGKFVRQSGGRGQYGDVWLRVSQMKLVKVLNSSTVLKVVLFQPNTSQSASWVLKKL